MKLARSLHAAFTLALVACTWLVLAPAVGAQTLYGTLTGSVVDKTGAAIPGATVTATNEGTGLTVDTVSDAEGAYTIRNLAPATTSSAPRCRASRTSRRRPSRWRPATSCA